jgi:hypothetical protein
MGLLIIQFILTIVTASEICNSYGSAKEAEGLFGNINNKEIYSKDNFST